MAEYDYDLYVIGAGSGGVRAARIAAQHGARVAVAEDQDLGGTCVNRGCVPKKFFVFSAQYGLSFEDAKAYGWQMPEAPRFDWPTLRDNKDCSIGRLNTVYEGLLTNAGVDIHLGHASLVDAHTVAVNGQHYRAERILLAVGGEPFVPDIPGKELAITSDDVFHLEALPEKVVIYGGGYIAVEFASIFNGLGLDVTIVYRGEALLKGFDHDLRHMLEQELSRKGITVLCNRRIASVEESGGTDARLSVTLSDGTVLPAGEVMMSTGRRPRIGALGLDRAGVATAANGAIQINDDFQTSVGSVYAIGDVTDRVNLTPVAIREGHWLADKLYGKESYKFGYADIPTAVFSIPEIGTVGLGEEEAVTAGHAIEIYRTRFRPMQYAFAQREEFVLMKLIVDAEDDRVLGVHMMGANAGEIIQLAAVAVRMGVKKADFDQTVAVHPSVSEEFVTMRTPVPSTLAQAAE